MQNSQKVETTHSPPTEAGGGWWRSVVSDSATPWTVAHQAPLSIGFSRQEHWSGLPLPAPGDLPDPGIEPTSLVSPALAGRFFTTEPADPLVKNIKGILSGRET